MKRITKTDVPEVLELLPEIEKYGGKVIRGKQIPYEVSEEYIEKGIIEQQNLVFFPNGYGASIVNVFLDRSPEERSLELAKIKITDKDAEPANSWDFYSENPYDLDDCFIRFQDKSEMLEVLKEISELDPHAEEIRINYYKTKKALDEKIEVLQKEVDKAIKVKGMEVIPLDRLPYYSYEILRLNFDVIYKAGVKDAVEAFRKMEERLETEKSFSSQIIGEKYRQALSWIKEVMTNV